MLKSSLLAFSDHEIGQFTKVKSNTHSVMIIRFQVNTKTILIQICFFQCIMNSSMNLKRFQQRNQFYLYYRGPEYT